MWPFNRPRLPLDSVFGPLAFYARDAQWTGRFAYESDRTVELNVCAGPDGPTPSQIVLFDELRLQYATIIDRIKNEMLALYAEEPMEMQLDHPMPRNADDLWARVSFDYVTIHTDGHSPEMTFAFSVPWDEEHGRYFEIAKWQIVDINM